jgi:uncharacterized protein (TIGR03086 family)
MIPLHVRALTVATPFVARALVDLDAPTPCVGWDLRALLSHMVGQNLGFAAALRDGDAPGAAYLPAPPDGWTASADALTSAFAGADGLVRLVEISADARFTVEQVAGIQLLDTVVHTWDVATALGEPFRPDAELLAATAAVARMVPTGEARGPAFAAPTPTPTDDPWLTTLAHLGRP